MSNKRVGGMVGRFLAEVYLNNDKKDNWFILH